MELRSFSVHDLNAIITITHPYQEIQHRVGPLGFPLSAGSYPEGSVFQIDREVSLRTPAGIAVAIAGRSECLRLAGPIRKPVVVHKHLQRVDVESNPAVVRRSVVYAFVNSIGTGWRADAGDLRSFVVVDGIVFEQPCRRIREGQHHSCRHNIG